MLRLVLLTMIAWIAWIAGLTAPVVDLGLQGVTGATGQPTFETAFSWRDLILSAGGLFLLWKATKDIHHTMDPAETGEQMDKKGKAALSFGSAIAQVLTLDLVFSIDSILTAIGMTDYLPVIVIAVIVAVTVMMIAATPLAHFF